MRKNPFSPAGAGILFSILFLYASNTFAMSASDREKYEAKGLSQVEWGMIQDAGMSEKKVDELLEAGISISEYFEYPWLSLGISEKEYLNKRKAGMLDADISAHSHKVEISDLAVVQNFFLPGFYQFKRGQKAKAFTMSGLAVGLAGLTAFLSIKEKTFIPAPLFFLLPDMLWSSFDLGIQLNKERNPDAERFSGYEGGGERVSFVLSLPIYSVKEN